MRGANGTGNTTTNNNNNRKTGILLFLLLCCCFIICNTTTTGEQPTCHDPNSNSKYGNGIPPTCLDDDDDDDNVGSLKDKFFHYWETLRHDSPEEGSLVDLTRISDKFCNGADFDIEGNPNSYATIPTVHDYELLVEAYVHASERNPNARGRPPTVTLHNPDSFLVPVEVRAIPHIGRGVFALEDIPAGTEVVRPVNAMEFYNAESLRDFMAYLVETESRIFCDVFMWLYATSMSSEDNDYTVCIDADHSSLINSGDDWDAINDDDDDDDDYDDDDYDDDDDDGYEDDKDEEKKTAQKTEYSPDILNIGQPVGVAITRIYGCRDPPNYALRDIKAGEELRMSYGDFSEPEGFAAMGLGHFS